MRARPSARLVLLNERDEVLLFHHDDPEGEPTMVIVRGGPAHRSYWVTPGGGVEAGESWEEAARRELAEDTGITGVTIGPALWSRRKDAIFFDGPPRAEERYFLVHAGAVDVSADYRLAHELVMYQEHWWWSLDALRATDEVVFPEDLAGHLEPVLAGTIPKVPVDISPGRRCDRDSGQQRPADRAGDRARFARSLRTMGEDVTRRSSSPTGTKEPVCAHLPIDTSAP